MKQNHYRCAKCDFWLATELDQYDHTCVPVRQPAKTAPTTQDEKKEDLDSTHSTYDDDEEGGFRWRKCVLHKPYTCTLAELKNCDACRLLCVRSIKD